MEIKVVQARLEDVEKVIPLFDAYRQFYLQESDLDGARQFISERLQQNDSVIFIAQDENDTAVAFTQLYPSFSSQSMQRIWILNDLFVVGQYRREGVASMLIEQAKKHCRGSQAKGLLLCTQHVNSSAQTLYRKQGFKPVAEYKWFFCAM